MAIQKVLASIEGISPLLMHAYPMVPVEGIEKKSPTDQCEACSYRTPVPERKLYVPGVAVQRAMVNGATYSKGKGRGSLQKPVAACVIVSPEYCILDNQSPTVDSRPVVIAATKGRIVRHRYRFDGWTIKFSVEWDDLLLKESELRRILDDTGSRVGLLDFRPEKKGPFGRFMVDHWENS